MQNTEVGDGPPAPLHCYYLSLPVTGLSIVCELFFSDYFLAPYFTL